MVSLLVSDCVPKAARTDVFMIRAAGVDVVERVAVEETITGAKTEVTLLSLFHVFI